jgi:hypothetical protein
VAIVVISAAISTAAAQTSADFNPLTRAAAMPRVQLQNSASSTGPEGDASSGAASGVCPVHVTANDVIVSDHEREETGFYVQPPGIIPDPSAWPHFAWSDTSLGVVRNLDGSGYLFFGSDGGCHENCGDQNTWRWGSVTKSEGTLDNPLGEPLGNPNPPVYEFAFPTSPNWPSHISYAGGGPVYRVPNGEPGAGSLLLVYHIERTANPFYSYTGIAKSTDEGMSWRDLGLILSVPHPFDPTGASDVGENPLVPYTDPATQQKYFYIFFPQHCWTATAQCSDFTFISVARAPYEALLTAAAAGNSLSDMFLKYYNGEWNQPGMGGLATETFPGVTGTTDGDFQIVWSDYRNRFIAMVDNAEYIAYGESVDGTYWPPMQTLLGPAPNSYVYGYANAVGLGEDPSVLGNTFYSYYTDSNDWQPSSVNRLTITTAATTTSVQPNVVTAGGSAFTLLVLGGHFTKDATVMWNNSPRATTFANSTTLYAQIPASDIASAGNAKVTVETPAPCGGRSNAQALTVLP